ncbi:tetratricopeptide repeat protein [Pseudomonas sp. PDM19]|uniref:tetratricopeptide repeat protein n=1 Tax=Pseudomonas sp. PDM19 TaxID=2769272 RepID=UPI00177E6B83|nr:tetratricopeptide repeat protein [Pseudomonas sp. PDM19]MBD9628746.1 tetratricopeptide repeat protein [Pseudomonas sp. PDM19]
MSAAEKKLNKLAATFRAALAKGNYRLGRDTAREALKIAPTHPTLLADYALCLMRTQDYEQAYKTYLKLLNKLGEENMPGTALDGLTEACGWLKREDLVRRYGNLSLSVADRKYSQFPAHPLPDAPPPAFDGSNPEHNLIVFSLFGARPRYCESALKNVEAAHELFPQWRCRFYVDDSVPQAVLTRLKESGAQVVLVDEATRSAIPATMWRFLVMEDREVSRFQVRDADSLLSERDRAAVEAWLQSGCWYHHMRDYFSHTELLLAGMWAGCHNPNLPGIRELIAQYLKEEKAHQRFADQYFLRRSLWPTIRQSLLSHDDLFGFLEAQPFPPHEPVRWQTESFHVGSNASYQGIKVQSKLKDGELQPWGLFDTEGTLLCRYESPVARGHWEEWIPYFLCEAIADGSCSVRSLAK